MVCAEWGDVLLCKCEVVSFFSDLVSPALDINHTLSAVRDGESVAKSIHAHRQTSVGFVSSLFLLSFCASLCDLEPQWTSCQGGREESGTDRNVYIYLLCRFHSHSAALTLVTQH